MKHVVIAGKTNLAVGGDRNREAVVRSNNVVLHQNAVGAVLHSQCVADRLHDRVVPNHRSGTSAGHEHAVVAVVVDQIVGHLAAKAGDSNARRITVDLIAIYEVGSVRRDAVSGVVVNAVVANHVVGIVGHVDAATVVPHVVADQRPTVIRADARVAVSENIVFRNDGTEIHTNAILISGRAVVPHHQVALARARSGNTNHVGESLIELDGTSPREPNAGGVRISLIPGDETVRTRQADSRAGRFDHVVGDDRVHSACHADAGVDESVGVQSIDVQAIAVGCLHAIVGIRKAQMRDRDVVRADDFNDGVVAGVSAATEKRDGVVRADDRDSRVLRPDHQIAQQLIVAGVDVNHITRPEIIAVQQPNQTRDRLIETLAGVQIIANRRGSGGSKRDVADRRVVVDIEIVAGCGNRERTVGNIGDCAGGHSHKCGRADSRRVGRPGE